MAQKLLSFKYQEEKKSQKIIGYSGLLPILEFSSQLGLFKYADRHIGIRVGDQGWFDSQVFLSLVCLKFVGGESVSDIDHLEMDRGLCHVLGGCESHLFGKRRVEINKRFRCGRNRFFPSDNSLHRYMEYFHNEFEEKRRERFVNNNEAFIPESNQNLKSLLSYYRHLCEFSQENNPVNVATLDVDAVVSSSNKRTTFFSYKNEPGYQPMNAYWAEQGLVAHTQFRDGNVPANYGVLDFVKESFSNIPDRVGVRFLRMDSSGYNFDLLYS